MKFKQTSTKINTQRGLTLVELMVAMAISSILMIGISNIYSSSKQAYKINDAYSVLQENARLAFRFLTQDIRMAGYLGCAWSSGSNVDSTVDGLSTDLDAFLNGFGTGLEGYDANGTGPNSTLDLDTPTTGFNRTVNNLFTGHIDGSDIIVIRHAAGSGIKLSDNKGSANFKIQDGGSQTLTGSPQCHGPSGICEGDVLMVSDCSKARLFQVSNLQNIGSNEIRVVHSTGNTPTSWGGSSTIPSEYYAPGDSEILKMGAYAYFVAPGASGLPTLKMLKNKEATPYELVEGVENMQVLYGVDGNGDGRANQYLVAPAVVTDNIVSVRISLLMSTPDEIPNRDDDTKTYKMLSQNDDVNVRVTPKADRRIRKVFTTTIKLRNKGLTN